MSVIKTYGKDGEQTGILIPLWHSDDGPKIDQVYLTAIFPGVVKGPHLHMKRRGLFYCIQGRINVVIRVKSVPQLSLSSYSIQPLRPGDSPIEVSPGTAAALYNPGIVEALVLNMPSPPWRQNDLDEHEVTDWTWKP